MITYTDSLEGITTEKLHGFFEGWRRPVSPEEHMSILEKSHAFILAVDEDSGNVAGFVAAVSDGVLSAYIPLLEVLPEYRNRGIGTELMRRILSKLNGMCMIDLMCEDTLCDFYERLGFSPARGMVIRNTTE